MTGKSGIPIALLNVATGGPEPGELLPAITERNLIDWETEWIPDLEAAKKRLKDADVPLEEWPQSRHWDWRDKHDDIKGILCKPSFSVVCGGVTQGMMIVDTATMRCRVADQQGKNLVYVKYIENAPWNRGELLCSPQFRGVGSILMRKAIELSHEEGFKGRVGLHALPQADSFYRDTCGMTDLKVDPDPQYTPMRYFEMTEEQAAAFIRKGEKP